MCRGFFALNAAGQLPWLFCANEEDCGELNHD
jgi:hypothetical protein